MIQAINCCSIRCGDPCRFALLDKAKNKVFLKPPDPPFLPICSRVCSHPNFMKVKMNFLVLQFSSKEVEDSFRNSIIRTGIWSELKAVEICTWQVVQLSTILFNEILFDLMPKFFEFLCKEFDIISNTALSGILVACYKTNSQLFELIFEYLSQLFRMLRRLGRFDLWMLSTPYL